MRLIAAVFLSLLVFPSFAASCFKLQTVYAFATSTTSAKTAYSVLIPDGATAIGSCPYVAITGAEYTQDITNTSNISALNTNINNVQTQANNTQNSLNSTNSTVNQLVTSVNAINSTMGGWDSKIAQNTQAVGTLNQILNEPFDLATGLAAFAFFFSTVLFFYGIARGAGAILEVIRRPLGRGV